MFIFIRLLLAHFIGDFPLQLDPIFKLKQKGLKGGIPHALIIVLCCLILSWPYLDRPLMWAFILFIGVIHLVQDSIKLSYNMPKYSFWTYLLDQAFHVGTIALLFFTDLRDLAPPPDQANIFSQLYSNNAVIAFLIALLIATYNGYYLIKVYKITFLKKADRHTRFERWYGMAERAVIVALYFAGNRLLYLLPAVILIRPILFLLLRKPLRLHKGFVSLADMLLSWGVAILSGYGLFLFQAVNSVY
jgi:hypothetical protein